MSQKFSVIIFPQQKMHIFQGHTFHFRNSFKGRILDNTDAWINPNIGEGKLFVDGVNSHARHSTTRT